MINIKKKKQFGKNIVSPILSGNNFLSLERILFDKNNFMETVTHKMLKCSFILVKYASLFTLYSSVKPFDVNLYTFIGYRIINSYLFPAYFSNILKKGIWVWYKLIVYSCFIILYCFFIGFSFYCISANEGGRNTFLISTHA